MIWQPFSRHPRSDLRPDDPIESLLVSLVSPTETLPINEKVVETYILGEMRAIQLSLYGLFTEF